MKHVLLFRLPALTLGLLGCACSEATPGPVVAEPDAGRSAVDAADRHLDAPAPLASGPQVPVAAPGCGGRAFQLSELQIASSAGLSLTIVSAEPEVPVVGNSSWLVALEDEHGAVVEAASRLDVTPYMPDHGHGTAVIVDVYEETPGTYRLAPINLRMPGYWEITLTLTGDAAAQSIMVPVCVD